MDIQRALIAKTLKDRALRKLVDQGIKDTFFPTPDHAAAYKWMLDYFNEYGESPGAPAFKTNFPTYKLLLVDEPIEFLIDELRRQRKQALIDELTMEVVTKRNDEIDVDEILSYIASKTSDTHLEVTELRDIDLVDTWEQRLEMYESFKSLSDGLRGIPTGFHTLDEATSGMQAGQLITVIGQPKSGKSTALLRMAINAHEFGKTVLFIGFEMSNDEQAARADSMRARVSHEKLMRGKLAVEDELKLEKVLKQVQSKYPHPFVLSQDVYSATTLSGVLSKVQQYRPDILFVDGVYMMDDDEGEEKGSPRHLTNLTRGFKRMAQQADIPIVITTQVLTWKIKQKKGMTADAIGYSSSFAQDSDLILGVEDTEDDDMKRLSVVLSRNTKRCAVILRWDWTFGEFEEIAEDDADGDEDDDDYGLTDSG